MMRLRELVPADLGPMSEPDDIVTLFGAPAFVYADLIRTAATLAEGGLSRAAIRASTFTSSTTSGATSVRDETPRQTFTTDRSVPAELRRFVRLYLEQARSSSGATLTRLNRTSFCTVGTSARLRSASSGGDRRTSSHKLANRFTNMEKLQVQFPCSHGWLSRSSWRRHFSPLRRLRRSRRSRSTSRRTTTPRRRSSPRSTPRTFAWISPCGCSTTASITHGDHQQIQVWCTGSRARRSRRHLRKRPHTRGRRSSIWQAPAFRSACATTRRGFPRSCTGSTAVSSGRAAPSSDRGIGPASSSTPVSATNFKDETEMYHQRSDDRQRAADEVRPDVGRHHLFSRLARRVQTRNRNRLDYAHEHSARPARARLPDQHARLGTGAGNHQPDDRRDQRGEHGAIDVVSYRLTVPSLTDALIAREAGGRARFACSSNRLSIEATSIPEYWLVGNEADRLWVAGIPIKIRIHDGLTHMKTLITSRTALLASSNYTKNWQRDHNYFIHARDQADALLADEERVQPDVERHGRTTPISSRCRRSRSSLVAPGAGAINVSTLADADVESRAVGRRLRRLSRHQPEQHDGDRARRRGAQRESAADLLVHAQSGAAAVDDLLLEGRLAHVRDRRRPDAHRIAEHALVHDWNRLRRRVIRSLQRHAGVAARHDPGGKLRHRRQRRRLQRHEQRQFRRSVPEHRRRCRIHQPTLAAATTSAGSRPASG